LRFLSILLSVRAQRYKEGGSMCDYSLCGIPNRLAVEGENLMVHRFQTGSMGLASPADLRPAEKADQQPRRTLWSQLKSVFAGGIDRNVVAAVCIPPGAYLVLKDIPEDLRRQWRVQSNEGVVFVQTSANVNSYRDALQFQDGRVIRLQDLREGLRVEVLSLASAFFAPEERELALV
jgi:hypothetical protein